MCDGNAQLCIRATKLTGTLVRIEYRLKPQRICIVLCVY